MILSAIAAKLKQRAKADFRGRHYEAALIVQAVSWYLRYPLSYRDIGEMLLERGLEVDHSALNCWVLAYAPLVEKRLRPFRRPHCGSVRIDETYIKVRGQWRYLYRAIDNHGEAVDFLLTANRDLDAAKRFFRKMLQDQPLLAPDRIGTDGAGPYPSAIAESRMEGLLPRTPVHYVTKHLQQGIGSDHFRSSERCRGWVASVRSVRPGAQSVAWKPCCGCARASALPARRPCASETSCWPTALDFLPRTEHESEPVGAILRPTAELATRPRRFYCWANASLARYRPARRFRAYVRPQPVLQRSPQRIVSTTRPAASAIVVQRRSAVSAGRPSRLARARQYRSPNDSPPSTVRGRSIPASYDSAASTAAHRIGRGCNSASISARAAPSLA